MTAFKHFVLLSVFVTCGIFYVGAARCFDGRTKSYACELLRLADAGTIDLWKRHSSGVRDNAYAYNNINDTCNGQKASLSKYTCKEGRAPGGEVCLTYSIVQYIDVVHQTVGYIHVNEIAGACHSTNSKHYLGRAVDLHKTSASDAKAMIDLCNSFGGQGIEEGNHIHCQI